MADRPDYKGKEKERAYDGSKPEQVYDGSIKEYVYGPTETSGTAIQKRRDTEKLVAAFEKENKEIDLFAVDSSRKRGLGWNL